MDNDIIERAARIVDDRFREYHGVGMAEHVPEETAHALADAGLLAKSRAPLNRDEIAELIAEAKDLDHAADAVLALLDRAATRDVEAEAWDEGLMAGQDRWMDAREFGDPPVNPYREGGAR